MFQIFQTIGKLIAFEMKILILEFQREVANREQSALTIDLGDLASIDQDLADACLENSKRYIDLFYEAVQELLPEYKDKDVTYGYLSDF